MNNFEDANE